MSCRGGSRRRARDLWVSIFLAHPKEDSPLAYPKLIPGRVDASGLTNSFDHYPTLGDPNFGLAALPPTGSARSCRH